MVHTATTWPTLSTWLNLLRGLQQLLASRRLPAPLRNDPAAAAPDRRPSIHRTGQDGGSAPANRCPPASRPAHGSWPFTVKTPTRRAQAPATTRPARVLRPVSDPDSGRLLIVGRMADVCVELDRLAAAQALQA